MNSGPQIFHLPCCSHLLSLRTRQLFIIYAHRPAVCLSFSPFQQHLKMLLGQQETTVTHRSVTRQHVNKLLLI